MGELQRWQNFKKKKKNSCEVLREAHESPPFSRAPLVVPKASPSNENKRILPGWTRRNRGITTASQSQGQPISGQKGAWRNQKKFLGCLQNAFMLLRLMDRKIIYWWRLTISPASSNELPSVELSRAWEPAYRKRAHGTCTGKRSFCCVFIRDTNR